MSRALAAVEHARGAILRAGVRMPLLGPALRKRERRVVLRASVAIAIAFAGAVLSPALLLAFSPILLGVPHVAASLRYLVVRQRLPRAFLVSVVSCAAALMTLRILEQYGHAPRSFARAEVAVASAWVFGAAAWAARQARAPRRFWVAAPPLALGALLLLAHPVFGRLLFVHVHNLGAVVVWALLLQRGRALLPLALLAGGLALLLGGFIEANLGATAGVDVEAVGRWLAPGAAASVAVPLVLAHVFTDSVHYAFWLGVIPEETLKREGTLTFRMTWRSLRADFGRAIWPVVGLVLLVPVLAVFGLARMRDAYYAIAGFHGYVEGVMLAALVVRGRRVTG
ncbi:MAG TPA: hypothetical protein VGH28_33145 [Polyangiaceae bacterium]|jgi:hypothetical protein